MSKQKNKNTVNLKDNNKNVLTNPNMLKSAIYFSVFIENLEEYFDFLNKYNDNCALLREVILDQKIIPKYFDIIIEDQLYDLKTLIAPLTIQPLDNNKFEIVNGKLDENKPHLNITYGEMLFNKAMTKESSDNLINMKNRSELPTIFETLHIPEIIDDKFLMTIKEENDYTLCNFDYVFPQKCVFAISLNILGNMKPIEKFSEKIQGGFELNEYFEEILQDIFEDPTIEIQALDLFSNSINYDHDLIEAKFSQNIDNAIENETNTIVFYDNYPVFISFVDNNLNIRLPFLTFDLFAQTILSHEKEEHLEFDYHLHTLQRLNASTILDDMGLEYEHILGQRVDFHHEPEMKDHIITKVNSREILEGNIYFENSDHDIYGHENDAVLATLAVVTNFNYPIFILTMQSVEHIVKQVNAYVIQPDEDGEEFDLISDFFEDMGGENVEHIAEKEVFDLQYCPNHRKLNGLFCHLNNNEE